MKFIFVICFAFLTACASSTKTEETPPPANPAVQTIPPESASLPTGATVAEALKAPQAEVATHPAVEKTAQAKPAVKRGVDPKQALKWLQNGNTRFVKNLLRRDGQSKKDIARLVSGQTPHAVILSCSDSRVPPEIVFDQKLGEIFVIRTADISLDKNVIASIENAVENLGSRLVLVMGHTQCGANNQGVIAELKKASPILQAAVESGDIEIKSALYHLNSGAVSFE